MSTFLELVSSRYSVRNYSKQAIEPELLDIVLEAGRVAPTACNNQPQRVMVISDADGLAKLDKCTPCRFGAPMALLVCYDKAVCWKRSFDGAPSGEIDASIVATHMMLAAHDLGLGTCWVMFFDAAKVVELFELPDGVVPMALLPIGYPTEGSMPSGGHSVRMSLDKMLL